MEPDYFQACLVVAKIFTDLVKKTAMTVARGKPDPQVFLCSSHYYKCMKKVKHQIRTKKAQPEFNQNHTRVTFISKFGYTF